MDLGDDSGGKQMNAVREPSKPNFFLHRPLIRNRFFRELFGFHDGWSCFCSLMLKRFAGSKCERICFKPGLETDGGKRSRKRGGPFPNSRAGNERKCSLTPLIRSGFDTRWSLSSEAVKHPSQSYFSETSHRCSHRCDGGHHVESCCSDGNQTFKPIPENTEDLLEIIMRCRFNTNFTYEWKKLWLYFTLNVPDKVWKTSDPWFCRRTSQAKTEKMEQVEQTGMLRIHWMWRTFKNAHLARDVHTGTAGRGFCSFSAVQGWWEMSKRWKSGDSQDNCDL